MTIACEALPQAPQYGFRSASLSSSARFPSFAGRSHVRCERIRCPLTTRLPAASTGQQDAVPAQADSSQVAGTTTAVQQPIDRRSMAALAAVGLAMGCGCSSAEAAKKPRAGLELSAAEVAQLSEKDWQARLMPSQYRILRKQGTEVPFSSGLHKEKRSGTYRCAGCGNETFLSAQKFNSGTGWPSFFDAVQGNVDLKPDYSIPFFPRTEVSCSRCHGHLGHVFEDGPPPTGLRYCMNGAALIFLPKDDAQLKA